MQNHTEDGLLADDHIAPTTSTVDMAEGCVNEYDYYESTEKWLLGMFMLAPTKAPRNTVS